MASFAYDVYVPERVKTRRGWDDRLKLIDTVFCSYKNVDECRRSLINHDGYRSDIVVKLRR